METVWGSQLKVMNWLPGADTFFDCSYEWEGGAVNLPQPPIIDTLNWLFFKLSLAYRPISLTKAGKLLTGKPKQQAAAAASSPWLPCGFLRLIPRKHACKILIKAPREGHISQTHRLQLLLIGRLPDLRRRVAPLRQPLPRVLPVGFVEPPGPVLSLLPAPGASVPAGGVQAAEVPHDESLDQQDGQSGDQQQRGPGAPGQPAGARVTVHLLLLPPSGSDSDWELHPLNADSGVWMLPSAARELLLAGREQQEEEGIWHRLEMRREFWRRWRGRRGPHAAI